MSKVELPGLVAVTVLYFASTSLDTFADEYSDSRAELVAAYQAQDYAAMRIAAARSLEARPEYPGALFNKAFSESLDGDADAAMETLGRLIEKGIDYGVEDIEAFAPLQEHPMWSSYRANIAAIQVPVGDTEVFARFDKPDFIPEGIAVADGGGVVLGSIRYGQLLIEAHDSDDLVIGPFGHWSVFGMRFDDREGLWFASSRVPQYSGISDRSAYMAGLYRLDLDSLEVDRRARLPVNGNDQVLGDLVIADDDTIFTTDSVDGHVYRFSISNNEFSTLVPKGVFGSPQGLVLDASGDYLYVADYIGGLFRVRLDDGHAERLSVPADISDYGIDGLYRHGNRLIVIQNGIQPHRVAALTLSADGLGVESAEILAMNLPEFDEPTLGTIVGDEFFFVANSHWNRFDQDNNLPDDLTGPIVLRLSLRGGEADDAI
jgi:sugar lactone lactonase YvrE